MVIQCRRPLGSEGMPEAEVPGRPEPEIRLRGAVGVQPCQSPFPAGFSLLEVMVALVLFQIGLLAVAGMVLTAQGILRRSDAVLRGTVEARLVADSLLSDSTLEGGERETVWGWLWWEPAGQSGGHIRILALTPDREDTLAVLRVWHPE